MKTHIKVVLRKGKVYKNNTSPIFIRLTQENRVKFITTGVSINPLYWDSEKSLIKEECPQREALQAKVDSKLASIHKQIAKLEILDLDVTLEALTPSNSNRFNPTLEECFEEDIEKLRQAEKVNTIIKHRFTLASISLPRTYARIIWVHF